MDPFTLNECIEEIAEKRPDLAYINPDEVDIRFDESLGEGGFCTAYRCTWNGASPCDGCCPTSGESWLFPPPPRDARCAPRTPADPRVPPELDVITGKLMCARVVDSNRQRTVVEEIATVEGTLAPPPPAPRFPRETITSSPPPVRKRLNRPTRVRAPLSRAQASHPSPPRFSVIPAAAAPSSRTTRAWAATAAMDATSGLAVVTELCPHGNLEDFMEREGVPLSAAVKLDVMLQVAKGLEQLKDARIVWRDLKAKNLLVRSAHRGRAGEVVKVSIAFTDWGTAVKMPEEGKRRMTLHGPGTAGYIAPDTRGPIYDYQADMWAYLVWAASMCLKVECIVDCQLEEALADLKLEKKANATSGQDTKVNELLRKFQADGKVDEGCDDLYELVRDSAPWVDASMRWSPEEAEEELTTFRADHGLVIDASAVQKEAAAPEPERRFKASCLLLDREYGRRLEAEYEANKLLREQHQHQHQQHQPTSTATEPAPPAVEKDTVEKDDDGESDWDEEAPTQPIAPTQPAPAADEMDAVEEEEEETPRGEEEPANVAAVVVELAAKKIDPYEFDLPEPVELDTSREMDASRETAFEAIAGTEDEASENEENEEEDEEENEEEEEEEEEEETERAAQRRPTPRRASGWAPGSRSGSGFRNPGAGARRARAAAPRTASTSGAPWWRRARGGWSRPNRTCRARSFGTTTATRRT